MTRIVVMPDACGVPTAQVPLPLLCDLAKCMPTEKILVAYQHATNHVLVSFPGWDAGEVQDILDDLPIVVAPTYEGFAAWPSLPTDASAIYSTVVGQYAAPGDANFDCAGEAGLSADCSAAVDSFASCQNAWRASPTSSVLATIDAVIEGLAPTEQDRLSTLVCDLKSTLAANRSNFNELFEAAPKGQFGTDLHGHFQHAAAAPRETAASPSQHGAP